jgi:hypothetical protein
MSAPVSRLSPAPANGRVPPTSAAAALREELRAQVSVLDGLLRAVVDAYGDEGERVRMGGWSGGGDGRRGGSGECPKGLLIFGDRSPSVSLKALQPPMSLVTRLGQSPRSKLIGDVGTDISGLSGS